MRLNAFVQSVLLTFAVLILVRLYGSQVTSAQLYSDIALALILGLFSVGFGVRNTNYSFVRVTVPNWPEFWREFMAVAEQGGFSPACKMDDNYFFEKKRFNHHKRLVLRKLADNQWEIEYPNGLAKLISQKLGVFTKLDLLTSANSK